ncbi:MAG: nickel-responsive transcriptional regulator NikR [Coriobacteriales bacterium]|nr:nickel-responsive transcriptional regulator NikR [Coriobacteriales bacterium]
MGKLVRFGVAMDEDLLASFDGLVKQRGPGVNRSEAVRDLVREAIVDSAVEDEDDEVVGTITMVFNHGTGDLSDKLDALQHEHHREVVSAMHVHLDAHNCLEVLVLRGRAGDVKGIADTLLGTKGVKHGRLVMTTTSGL